MGMSCHWKLTVTSAKDVSYLEIHDYGRLVLEAKTRRDVLDRVREPLILIHVQVGLPNHQRDSEESSTLGVTDGEGFSTPGCA